MIRTLILQALAVFTLGLATASITAAVLPNWLLNEIGPAPSGRSGRSVAGRASWIVLSPADRRGTS